jgi:hypothetical protein
MFKKNPQVIFFIACVLFGFFSRAHASIGLSIDGDPVSFGSLDVNSTSDPKSITLHPYSTADWTLSISAPVLTNSAVGATIPQNQFVYWWESSMPGSRTPSSTWAQAPVPASPTQVYASSGDCSAPGSCNYVMGFKVYLTFQAAGAYSTTITVTILNNE